MLSPGETTSWNSVDLMSLSPLVTHGINATELYKRVIFPEVSGGVHCSLSDIKKELNQLLSLLSNQD